MVVSCIVDFLSLRDYRAMSKLISFMLGTTKVETRAVTLVGAPKVRPRFFGHRDCGFVACGGWGVAEVLWGRAAWWEVEYELVEGGRLNGDDTDYEWGGREHKD
jgi:hypothetical protein